MLNVFIDTNIFLGFYSLSERDIEELKKLIKLIDDEEIQLILSRNVLDEFYKNRIKKIYATTSSMEKSNQIPLPTILKQYETECNEFRKAQSELKEKYTTLKNKLMEDVKSEQLSADRIINQIFKKAKIVPVDWGIFDKADKRFMRKLPPRKNDNQDSMGDAINWETLKKTINENEDLHIISEDGDYWDSVENQNDIAKYFLAKEWKDEKNGNLYIYASIKAFFDNKFASYDFVVDEEKVRYIYELTRSGSYYYTHQMIQELNKYNPIDFTLHEVNLILDAYIKNPQISWIAQDDDVKKFFFKLVTSKKDSLNHMLYLDALKIVDPEKYEDEEIPF